MYKCVYVCVCNVCSWGTMFVKFVNVLFNFMFLQKYIRKKCDRFLNLKNGTIATCSLIKIASHDI